MLKGPVSQSPHCQEGNAVTRGSVGVTYRAWGARGWGGQEVPLMEGTASRVPTVRRRQAGARPIQQRPRHSPGLRSREESVEQHDKPGARAQALPPRDQVGVCMAFQVCKETSSGSYAGKSSGPHM